MFEDSDLHCESGRRVIIPHDLSGMHTAHSTANNMFLYVN